MKLKNKLKKIFVEGICLLYILLFVYAAISKLLDFENFQIQIGQSPLLSAFTGLVSYGVPIVELGIVMLFLFPKYRLWGFYGSFFLMTMFTIYIFIILNFSSFTPCSCGGILEKMGWTEHLIFNILFVLLAGLSIAITSTTKFTYSILTLSFLSGIGILTLLFILSEDIMQHRNNFVRRFPDQVHKVYDTDLNFNSYYFAGTDNGKIYLGNYTAPLLLTEVDSTLKTKKEIVIHIDNMKLPFRSLELRVLQNNFFAIDGTVPCLFKGSINKWKANSMPLKNNYFANPVVIDSTSIVLRTHKLNGESTLGTIHLNQKENIQLNPTLLQKQIDGNFDCDGTLMFDNDSKKVIYLYRYRNQYLVADPNLNLIIKGKTIDTINKAQIKIAYNKSKDEKKLATTPLTVNEYGAVHKRLLFVHSLLIGKYEDAKMWNQTSVIDIYDIKTNSYLVSFYVYNIDGKKMKRFVVTDTHFYALIGTHIVSYRLSDMIKNQFSRSKKNTKI